MEYEESYPCGADANGLFILLQFIVNYIQIFQHIMNAIIAKIACNILILFLDLINETKPEFIFPLNIV